MVMDRNKGTNDGVYMFIQGTRGWSLKTLSWDTDMNKGS